jgi:hypothetical protein
MTKIGLDEDFQRAIMLEEFCGLAIHGDLQVLGSRHYGDAMAFPGEFEVCLAREAHPVPKE